MNAHYHRVRDQITDELRGEIMTGQLPEGTPLREIPLSERFQVSRGPIRDALLQLTQEGLLETRPNRGSRVGPVWDADLRELMIRMRIDLESHALTRVIERDPPVDLRPVHRNLRHFQVACEDGHLPTVVQYDLEFHRMLLRLSGVAGLETVWHPLMGGMRLPYSRHRSLLESHHEHRRIIEAVEAGDRREALAALRANIH